MNYQSYPVLAEYMAWAVETRWISTARQTTLTPLTRYLFAYLNLGKLQQPLLVEPQFAQTPAERVHLPHHSPLTIVRVQANHAL